MPVNRCPNSNCEYFNRVLPNNAKVCPMCGTTLGNAIAPEPAAPNHPSINLTPAAPPQPPRPTPVNLTPPSTPDATEYQARWGQSTPAFTPPTTPNVPLLKLIHSSGREFNLLGDSGYLGRSSPSKPTPPEIDLAGIAHEGIISRQHARLAWDWGKNVYTIVDLSTNGIYLNGNPLDPGVPYRLTDGDSLRLGQENLVNFQVSIG